MVCTYDDLNARIKVAFLTISTGAVQGNRKLKSEVCARLPRREERPDSSAEGRLYGQIESGRSTDEPVPIVASRPTSDLAIALGGKSYIGAPSSTQQAIMSICAWLRDWLLEAGGIVPACVLALIRPARETMLASIVKFGDMLPP